MKIRWKVMLLQTVSLIFVLPFNVIMIPLHFERGHDRVKQNSWVRQRDGPAQ